MNNHRTRHLDRQIELYKRWIENDRAENYIRRVLLHADPTLWVSEEEFIGIGKSDLQIPTKQFGGTREEFLSFLENCKLLVTSLEFHGCFPNTAYFRYRTLGLLGFHDTLVAGLENLVSDPSNHKDKRFRHLSIFEDSGLIDEYVDLIREQEIIWVAVFLEHYVREMIRLILRDYYHSGVDLTSFLRNCKHIRKEDLSIKKSSDIDKLLENYSTWRHYKDILSNGFQIQLDDSKKYHLTVSSVNSFRNLLVHNHGIIDSKVKKNLPQFELVEGERFYPDRLFCGNLISFCQSFAAWFDKEVAALITKSKTQEH